VRAVHDLSEGGLGIAIAEMCSGGRCGAVLTLSNATTLEKGGQLELFGETLGCMLVEVDSQQEEHFCCAL